MSYARYNGIAGSSGGGGGGVTSLNGDTGDLSVVAGNGITVTNSSPTITVSAQQAPYNYYVGTNGYATIQEAVNAAQASGNANTVGNYVTVYVPGGNYPENVLIQYNVNLVGIGDGAVIVQSLTLRPFSTSICPQASYVAGITVTGELFVDNQTSNSSGIYNPNMGLTQIKFENCVFQSSSTANTFNNINVLKFYNCDMKNADGNAYTNVNELFMFNTSSFAITFTGNNSLSNLPTNSGFFEMIMEACEVEQNFILQQAGGTSLVYLEALNCYFTHFSPAAGAHLLVYGGGISNYTPTGTPVFTVWGTYAPYTPGTSANWATPPLQSDVALNDLAASGVAKTQTENTVLAGPSSGSAALPTFRALVAADLPGGFANQSLSNLTSPTSVNQSLIPSVTDGSIVLGSATNYWGAGYIEALFDTTGAESIDTFNRLLVDAPGATSVQWGNRALLDSGSALSMDWNARKTVDPTSFYSVDWGGRFLVDTAGSNILAWAPNLIKLFDSVSNIGDAITLTVPTLSATYNLTLPAATGTGALTNDGSGNLSWAPSTNALMSNWVAYTPTVVGFGTITGSSFFSRRMGDSLEVKGTFTAGTPSASTATVTIGYNGTNPNVTIDPTKIVSSGNELAGAAAAGAVGSGSYTTLIVSTDTGNVYFGVQATATAGTAAQAGTGLISIGAVFSFYWKGPISGWSWNS